MAWTCQQAFRPDNFHRMFTPIPLSSGHFSFPCSLLGINERRESKVNLAVEAIVNNRSCSNGKPTTNREGERDVKRIQNWLS